MSRRGGFRMNSTRAASAVGRRGRRHPVRAHAVAVSASLRLHCGARSEVAPLNSLRFAPFKQTRRVRSGCALRAPTSALRSSSPHKSPPPGATCRAVNVCGVRDESKSRFSEGAFGQAGARLWGAEKRRARGRARSAHQHLTRRVCLTGESVANAGSSATWPRDRASQGSRSEAQAAPAKRASLPERAFAAQRRGGPRQTQRSP
jgi:hypothetical protein